MQPTREDAWALLTKHTTSDSLIKHALAVEAAMRAYARQFGEDEERWAVTGLIHDFDYEQHPDLGPGGHVTVGCAILRDLGWPEEMVVAVEGHATYLDVPRTSRIAKTLFAVDELTGLIAACALVRPSKSILDLTARSVRKKWKDKAFARGVSREDIEMGAAELGVDLGEHIALVIEALKPVADALGLVGEGATASGAEA